MSGNLHQHLAEHVSLWRTSGFRHEQTAIAEILTWAHAPEGVGFTLRPPQVRALETYWYLRLVKDTPRILDLYRNCFPRKQELLDALGAHLPGRSRQIEEQTRRYEVREEAVETALALVKTDGFRREITAGGVETYTAEISYPVDRERLLISLGSLPKGTNGDFGFHYEPYNFDSGPEVSFFQEMLTSLNLHPGQVEDIYFTGALTSPRQTDFFVDYKGEDGDWHRYTPDFVIRRKDGRCLIVEIKDARWEATTREDLRKAGAGEPALTVEGRKAIAVKRWEDLNPDRLKYELIFASEATIPYNDLKPARDFIEEPIASCSSAVSSSGARPKGRRKGARP